MGTHGETFLIVSKSLLALVAAIVFFVIVSLKSWVTDGVQWWGPFKYCSQINNTNGSSTDLKCHFFLVGETPAFFETFRLFICFALVGYILSFFTCEPRDGLGKGKRPTIIAFVTVACLLVATNVLAFGMVNPDIHGDFWSDSVKPDWCFYTAVACCGITCCTILILIRLNYIATNYKKRSKKNSADVTALLSARVMETKTTKAKVMETKAMEAKAMNAKSIVAKFVFAISVPKELPSTSETAMHTTGATPGISINQGSVHRLSLPKEGSVHTMSRLNPGSEHTLSQPNQGSEHTLSQPNQGSEHTLSQPNQGSEHTLSQPNPGSEHTLSQPNQGSVHTLSQPNQGSVHILPRFSKGSVHALPQMSADAASAGSPTWKASSVITTIAKARFALVARYVRNYASVILGMKTLSDDTD